MAISLSEASDSLQHRDHVPFGCRELQAQEALQNGQLSAGDGVPDLQPGVLASQALMEKILGEDPRWQGNPAAAAGAGGLISVCKVPAWWTSSPPLQVRRGDQGSIRAHHPQPLQQPVWSPGCSGGGACMAGTAPARCLVPEPAWSPAASTDDGYGQ